MGFKQVADLDCDSTVSLGGTDRRTNKKNPTSIEGYFIGTKQVPSTKAKTGFCSLHTVQTQQGNTGVWGKTNLDQKMKAVQPGQMVRISFVGMVETKNNPMYKYKVEVDETNTIDVSPSSAGPQNGDDTDNSSSGDDVDDTDLADDQSLPDEVPPHRSAPPQRAAAAPSADRQRQVQDLLRGSKRQ